MGLDGVELIMATEEMFGINFPDDVVYKLDTPGKVINYIYEQIGLDDNGRCASHQAFNLLRDAIQNVFHLERKIITLQTPVKSFIPNAKDGKSWFELQKALNARSWPKLRRAVWLRSLLIVTVLTLPVLCFFYFYPKFGSAYATVFSLIAMTIAGTILDICTKPFRNTIPNHNDTVKDLAPYAQTSGKIIWTQRDIASRFRQLVIEQTGIKESQYREDARFLEDLGID